mmetsp:Transcript_4496/g.14109  ORF Transcript_4496/g.14109 Transcript_4496/m.14109 type:complete len:240 (-) Transcript_4496:801-1520(-)
MMRLDLLSTNRPWRHDYAQRTTTANAVRPRPPLTPRRQSYNKYERGPGTALSSAQLFLALPPRRSCLLGLASASYRPPSRRKAQGRLERERRRVPAIDGADHDAGGVGNNLAHRLPHRRPLAGWLPPHMPGHPSARPGGGRDGHSRGRMLRMVRECGGALRGERAGVCLHLVRKQAQDGDGPGREHRRGALAEVGPALALVIAADGGAHRAADRLCNHVEVLTMRQERRVEREALRVRP